MSNNEDDVFMGYVKQISFLGMLALIVLWVIIILTAFFSSFGAADKNAADQNAIAERLQAIEVVAIKEAAAPEPVATATETPVAADTDAGADTTSEIDGNAIVTATCAACHVPGILESPKIGDKEAWDKRLQANGDLDGLVKSAIVGKGAMPPRGGNAGLSDEEVKAAVEFMMQ